MKHEDVKSKIPGITDEQLDWLMGEHGRDVTAEKTRATNLQAQVDTLTGQLQTAQDGLKAFEVAQAGDGAAETGASVSSGVEHGAETPGKMTSKQKISLDCSE